MAICRHLVGFETCAHQHVCQGSSLPLFQRRMTSSGCGRNGFSHSTLKRAALDSSSTVRRAALITTWSVRPPLYSVANLLSATGSTEVRGCAGAIRNSTTTCTASPEGKAKLGVVSAREARLRVRGAFAARPDEAQQVLLGGATAPMPGRPIERGRFPSAGERLTSGVLGRERDRG